ncbi:MAG: LLM class flavin-dependent oxidoreductase [Candidatus Ranarchaeia archaeon]
MVSFGIGVINDLPLKQTIRMAQTAEKNGFDYFWIADENPSPPFRDVWVAYSAVLHNTERIKLATGINTPYTRHPALLAVAMNSFNELFPGRAHLGLGPGGWLTLHPLNIPIWNRPIRALRETFEIIQRLMKGEMLKYEGEIFQALDVKLEPPPAHPWENWLACRGPQMIKLAGRFADGTMLTAPTGYIPFVKEKLKEGADKAGRSLDDIVIGNFLLSAVADKREKAYEEVSKELCFVVADTPDICHKHANISMDDVTKLREARNSQGLAVATKAVTPEMIEAYSLTGTVDDIVDKVKEQISAGVEHLIFSSPFDPEDPIRGVETLGKEVISRFR